MVNYAFNDGPAQKQNSQELQAIKQQLDELSRLASDIPYVVSYVKAQEQLNPTLWFFMKQNQPKRPLKTAKQQDQLEGLAGLMDLGDFSRSQTAKNKQR